MVCLWALTGWYNISGDSIHHVLVSGRNRTKQQTCFLIPFPCNNDFNITRVPNNDGNLGNAPWNSIIGSLQSELGAEYQAPVYIQYIVWHNMWIGTWYSAPNSFYGCPIMEFHGALPSLPSLCCLVQFLNETKHGESNHQICCFCRLLPKGKICCLVR